MTKFESSIETYRQQSRGESLSGRSWENLRFVVLDTESTGLDARKDKLISIGAVAIIRQEIELADSFEIMMPIAYNTSSVMVHGITREASAESGIPEDQALAEFLSYLRDGIIVGHHIGHDVEMLGNACEKHFGFRLFNETVDTLDLTLRLQAAGLLGNTNALVGYSLDDLCRHFHVVPHDRHTASGDAFITAQIFIRLLHKAWAAGMHTLAELTQRWEY
jgi:DNA polymerase-3 subunit epsilon